MSKELIVSSTAHETKVAILEDDELVELFFERERQYGLAGSIYKGRVTRVLPGMQSAFVNIGLERDAFLYVSDFFEDTEEYDRIVTTVEDKVVRMEEKGEATAGRNGEPAAPAAAPAEAAPPAAPAAEPEAPRAEAPRADAPPRQEDTERQPPQLRDSRDPRESRDSREGWNRRGRRGRRRGRPPGRGFPDSKFASRSDRPHPTDRSDRPDRFPRPDRFEPPQRSDTPERPDQVRQPRGFSGPTMPHTFQVLPGESLAKYSHPDDEEAAALGQEELQPELQADADNGAAIEEEDLLDGLVQESLPDRAVPESPLNADVSSEVSAAAAPEPPEMGEPWPETSGPEASGHESSTPEASDPEEEASAEAAAEPETTETAAAAAGSGAAEVRLASGQESQAEAESDDDAQPAHLAAGQPAAQQASLRERPYGQRFLHRERSERGDRGDRGPRRMRRRGRDFRDRRETAPETAAPARPTSETNITDLLKEGQEIIVQIAKEPIGKKGARITSHIALPGRYLVYMPTVDHVGVSRKIQSEEERHRLKRVVQTHRVGMPGGFIVRTAGDGQSEEEIRSDMHFLYNLWLDLRQKAERIPAASLVHHDLNLVERLLRDQLTETFKTIWVDSQEDYERILGFVERFQPKLVNRVKLYTRANPIFDEFGITQELEKALRPKVWLKSGGYIVINQTEALVAIDVNTGKYVGKSNRLEDTIVKTNMDAIKEIVRQIRLRDLGGIIVVDFIDMDERKNRQKVMGALDEALRSDRSPSKILQFNDFGLVAITRKRVKQSLERTLCAPCPYCDGSGYVKSVQTMIQEILTEAKKIARSIDGRDVTLRVNPEVARLLKSRENSFLEEIETILRRPVLIKGDPQLHQEKFDFN